MDLAQLLKFNRVDDYVIAHGLTCRRPSALSFLDRDRPSLCQNSQSDIGLISGLEVSR
jgi:hypothetical protein